MVIVGHEVTAWPEQRILEQEQQEVGLDTEARTQQDLRAQLGNGGRWRGSEPSVAGWKQRFRKGSQRANRKGRRLTSWRPSGLSSLR